jgi:hypothetical protein
MEFFIIVIVPRNRNPKPPKQRNRINTTFIVFTLQNTPTPLRRKNQSQTPHMDRF